MRSLLLRDWKLYRFTLILPFSFCVLWALLFYVIQAFDKRPATFDLAIVPLSSAAVMASLRIHGLHLLEVANGTLTDLTALPRSRATLVWLRLVEALLLSFALLVVILLEGYLILRGVTGSSLGLLPSQLGPTSLKFGWILFFALLLPMPFVLRWGSRGFTGLILGIVVGLSMTSYLPKGKWSDLLFTAWTWLTGHPAPQAFALVLLSALAIAISIKIIQSQDL